MNLCCWKNSVRARPDAAGLLRSLRNYDVEPENLTGQPPDVFQMRVYISLGIATISAIERLWSDIFRTQEACCNKPRTGALDGLICAVRPLTTCEALLFAVRQVH